MRDMFRLFIVIVIFSAVSGGLLATVRNGTKDKIEYQQLKFVKGPTIKQIMEGCENDPLTDRFKIMDGKKERSFFIGTFEGEKNTVAFESFGKGYGGDVGVIAAINVKTDEIVGIGVTTHSETPGVGSRAKSEPDLSSQFKGLSIKEPFKVTADGGKVDAISGATITSRGVCSAVATSANIYDRLKKEILKKVKA